ncbi:hypothetical protein MAR_032454 [Mya arenaria]|uniref:Galectin n=1 Tax=Mya arenaria TaxID=6604 RepID=A0ABY7F7C8_MYAAR|nr:hypothetical protein MAR_032454 [Mya arenaria]
MDANNFYIHVAIRYGYFLIDFYKDGAWCHVPLDKEYPGIVGQVQELTLEIHSDHCQVFLDNAFLGQSETPLQASKMTSLEVCPENSAVVELHSVDYKSNGEIKCT